MICSTGLVVGFDLKGFSQPKQFHDSFTTALSVSMERQRPGGSLSESTVGCVGTRGLEQVKHPAKAPGQVAGGQSSKGLCCFLHGAMSESCLSHHEATCHGAGARAMALLECCSAGDDKTGDGLLSLKLGGSDLRISDVLAALLFCFLLPPAPLSIPGRYIEALENGFYEKRENKTVIKVNITSTIPHALLRSI